MADEHAESKMDSACVFSSTNSRHAAGKEKQELVMLKLHPEAYNWGILTGENYEQIKDSIELHGQLEPIEVIDEHVVDGMVRQQCCLELGLRPMYVELDPSVINSFGGIREYSIIKNRERRHLSASQRAMSAALATEARLDEKMGNLVPECTSPTELMCANAASFGVSKRYAYAAKAVIDGGDEEVVKAVKAGKVSVKAAEALVRATTNRERQRRIVNEAATAKNTFEAGKFVEEAIAAQRSVPAASTRAEPKPSTKDVADSEKAIGVLIRAMGRLGLYEKHRTSLAQIAADIERLRAK